MPLIDTKQLGKPPALEGDVASWRPWRFQVLVYFGAVEPALCEELMLAEMLATTIAFNDLTAAKQARSRVVFMS